MTGKWKLVSMSGVERLSPHIAQYMELTKEEVGTSRDGYPKYKAEFINFQEEFGTTGAKKSCDSLFTTTGTWSFYSGDILLGITCNPVYSLKKKEGLILSIVSSSNFYSGEIWKINLLTNKDLKLSNGVCIEENCYKNPRILEFKKE